MRYPRLKHKNILLTGASGFIGFHLLKSLTKLFPQSHIYALSRNTTRRPNFKNITWLSSNLHDLEKSYWVKNGIRRFDYVFHLGAFTPKNSAQANQIDDIFQNNVIGTKCLLSSLPSPPKKLIYSSSLDVYDLRKGKKVDEFSPTNPSSFYGASKLFGEGLIKAHASENKYNYTILRYGHIYGPGEDQYHKLVPETIRMIQNKKPPVQYGNPETLRSLLFVDDAVVATVRAIFQSEQGPINIVAGKSYPIKKIIKTLLKISKSNLKVKQLHPRENNYSHRFSNELMKKLLGHWPFVSLEEGLKREWNWMQSKTTG